MSRKTNSRRQQLFQKNQSLWCQRKPGFCPYMLFSPAGWALVSPSVSGDSPPPGPCCSLKGSGHPGALCCTTRTFPRVSIDSLWNILHQSIKIFFFFLFLSLTLLISSWVLKKKKEKKPPVTLTIHSHHLLGWIENDHKKKPNITITLKEMTLVSDWSQLASKTDSFLSFRESTKYQYLLLWNVAFTAT